METRAIHPALLIQPPSVHSALNAPFGLTISIDSNSIPLAAADVWLVYDPSYLKPIEPFASTSVFPASKSTIVTPGRLYIAGFSHDASQANIIGGTLAQVEFQTLREGTTAIGFDCATTAKFTSQIIAADAQSTNIIDCEATSRVKTEVVIGSNGSNARVLGASDSKHVSSQLSLSLFALILMMIVIICAWYVKKYSVLKRD